MISVRACETQMWKKKQTLVLELATSQFQLTYDREVHLAGLRPERRRLHCDLALVGSGGQRRKDLCHQVRGAGGRGLKFKCEIK